MLTDPVLEFPGARRPAEESTTAAKGLGGRERLVTTVDELAATLGAMVGVVVSSEADAGVVDAMA